MFLKKLSQTFGAIGKGYAYDTPLTGLTVMQKITAPAASSTTAVHAAVTLTTSAQVITTGLTNPGVPRALTITGSASGIVGDVTIYGKDVDGYNRVEKITASGTATVAGNFPFASVYKISFPIKTHSSGDTIAIGTSDKLGLDRPILSASDIVSVQSGDGGLMLYGRPQWTDLDTADAALILNDQATSASVTTVVTTGFLAQPDVARCIVVTPGGTTADVPSGDVTIVGTDISGAALTQAVTFAANATGAQTTTKAFATVTSITFPIQDGAGATYDVGSSVVIGLPFKMAGNYVQNAYVDGTKETTAPTVTFSSSVLASNTISFNTAPNGSRDFEIAVIPQGAIASAFYSASSATYGTITPAATPNGATSYTFIYKTKIL